MKIIKAHEAITVEHPVFCIFGWPGIGKSSLGYSAKDPLVLDFDGGAHRAANRRDTLAINKWDDVVELMENPDALFPYSTVVVDTVGRCLDLLTADLIANNSKHSRGDGNLTQNGYGALKNGFRSWLTRLRAMGKDVVLISHNKEEKDGDLTVNRPDIMGGSYGEVMKSADFVGFIYMNGKKRILDFNPSDRWFGKNPGNWKPIEIPAIDKAQNVLAELIDKGRAALGAISSESSGVASQIDTWRDAIEGYANASDCNKGVEALKSIKTPIIHAQVRTLIIDRAKALQLYVDPKTKEFVDEKPEKVAV